MKTSTEVEPKKVGSPDQKENNKFQENKMPLEGKQLQNVTRTVQQVVNEEQEIREIEEMLKKATAMGAPDKVTEGLGSWIKSKTTDKVKAGIKKAADDFKKDMGDTKKFMNMTDDEREAEFKKNKEKYEKGGLYTQSDAQKKIDDGERAPAGWRNVDGKAVEFDKAKK